MVHGVCAKDAMASPPRAYSQKDTNLLRVQPIARSTSTTDYEGHLAVASALHLQQKNARRASLSWASPSGSSPGVLYPESPSKWSIEANDGQPALLGHDESSDSECDLSDRSSSHSSPTTPTKTRRFRMQSIGGVKGLEGPILEAPSFAVAKIITKIDARDFCKITKDELLSFEYGSTEKCPNIVAVTKRFNNMIYWIATSILKHDTAMKRAKLVRKFIAIGIHLLELQNFNGVVMIVNGLKQVAVHRLKETWAFINKNPANSTFRAAKRHHERLNETADLNDNYKRLREVVGSAAGYRSKSKSKVQTMGSPLVPYLGLYLRDLTMLSTLHQRKDGEDWHPKINAVLDSLSLYKFLAGLYFKDRDWKHGIMKNFHTEDDELEKMLYVEVQPLVDLPQQMRADELYKLSLSCEGRRSLSSIDLSAITLNSKQRSLSDGYLDLFNSNNPKSRVENGSESGDMCPSPISSPVRLASPTKRTFSEGQSSPIAARVATRFSPEQLVSTSPQLTFDTRKKTRCVERSRFNYSANSAREKSIGSVASIGGITNESNSNCGRHTRSRSQPFKNFNGTPPQQAMQGQGRNDAFQRRGSGIWNPFGSKDRDRHLRAIPQFEEEDNNMLTKKLIMGDFHEHTNMPIKLIMLNGELFKGPFWGQYPTKLSGSHLLITDSDGNDRCLDLEGFALKLDTSRYTKKENAILLNNIKKQHIMAFRFENAAEVQEWKGKLQDSLGIGNQEGDEWLIDLDTDDRTKSNDGTTDDDLL